MDLKSHFKTLIENGNLSQGYIFWGNAGSALNLATWLAYHLENKPKFLVDAKFINSIDGTVGISQVREINSFLWQKPLSSSRKILVIKTAGQLTPQAQSALLKIAEEPPKHGLIILIVEKLEQLLPTLQSRFQKIYINLGISDIPNNTLEFINLSKKEKVNFIKKILEKDKYELEDFIKLVMAELDKDPIKNFKPLKELLTYWTNICQYNTNKKLQLEAWIESFN